MPRNYKPKPQSRKYGSCDKDTLVKAFDMVAAEKSQRATCAELGITLSTFQNKINQRHKQKPG